MYRGALLIFAPQTGPNTLEFVPSPTGGRGNKLKRVQLPFLGKKSIATELFSEPHHSTEGISVSSYQ
jgi:hypothetical protein